GAIWVSMASMGQRRFEIQMPWRGTGKQDGYDVQGRAMLGKATKQERAALGTGKRCASRCRLAGGGARIRAGVMRSGCRLRRKSLTKIQTWWAGWPGPGG
ncbi:MAG: hypothetical protein QW360_03525, partial [Thermofilum sp.]